MSVSVIIKSIKKCFLLLIVFGHSTLLSAQSYDLINTAQYRKQLNRAYIGFHNSDWRISNIVNSKYVILDKPFRSVYLSGEYQYFLFPDKIALGADFIRKEFVNSPVNESQFTFAIKYHKKYQKHGFHFSIFPSLKTLNADLNSLTFPDQYDRNTGQFNSAVGSQEDFVFDRKNLFSINFGIVYGTVLKDYKTELGLAFHNVNKPDQSLNSYQINTPVYIVFDASIEKSFNNYLRVKPHLIFKLSDLYDEVVLGGTLGYTIQNNSFLVKGIYFGTYLIVRNEEIYDNLNFILGVNSKRIELNFGVGLPITKQSELPQRVRNFEITLTYNGFSALLEQYKIPCQIF